MPSKKSKTLAPKPLPTWKVAQDCSESELVLLGGGMLAQALGPTDRVLLEGELGMGKTTLAKALLAGRRVSSRPEGSPSFPIAHEYRDSSGRRIIHLDLYRLETEEDLEHAGVFSFLNEEALILIEWASKFEGLFNYLLKGPRHLSASDRDLRSRTWKIEITAGQDPAFRNLKVEREEF